MSDEQWKAKERIINFLNSATFDGENVKELSMDVWHDATTDRPGKHFCFFFSQKQTLNEKKERKM